MNKTKKLIDKLFPSRNDYNQWVVNVLKDIRQKKYTLKDITKEIKKIERKNEKYN